MSYQKGKVHVWVCRDETMAWALGTECTVTGPMQAYIASNGARVSGWPTDSRDPMYEHDHTIWAFAGDLRPKEPPSGEKSIMEQFKILVRKLVPA